jgi:2-polyprenyl-3-methyl-5-hydroxy-6-metoxy-1,4-benzoquinol methylase
MRVETKKVLDTYECVYKKVPEYGSPSRSHTMVANRATKYKERGVTSAFEISCGKGVLLKEMKLRGIPTVASEPCLTTLSRYLKPFTVYPYMLHELDAIPDGSYDFVYSVNVADHMADCHDAILVLVESARIAEKGFVFLVNGDRFMRKIEKSTSWWLKAAHSIGGKEVLYSVDALGGGDLIEVWF